MSPIPPIARRRGFTLTEMLVVIGIIVLVLSIATPMIARAWRQGDRARMTADLQAISTALEAYRQDHGSYPLVLSPPPGIDTNFDGARMLCRALIGPGPETHPTATYIPDGKGADVTPANPQAPGPGFRTRSGSGKVYGPYLPLERFKLGDPSGSNTIPGYLAIMDKYNHPILYYGTIEKPNIRLAKGFVGTRPPDRPLYNFNDNKSPNLSPLPPLTLAEFAGMLGDTNGNGMIDSAVPPATTSETPAWDGPYLLWSAGPDERFGPAQPNRTGEPMASRVLRSDDITNFR